MAKGSSAPMVNTGEFGEGRGILSCSDSQTNELGFDTSAQ